MRQPAVDPEGWVSLRKAFYGFGRAAIGYEFGGATILASTIEQAIGANSDDCVELEVDAEGSHELRLTSAMGAALFTRPVCRSFCSAARAGQLVTAYATKGAGPLQIMPQGAWRTDNDFARFLGWSFDPENLARADLDAPCWIFVSVKSLQSVEAHLTKWRSNLPIWNGEAEPSERETYCNKWPLRFEQLDDKVWALPPDLPNFREAVQPCEETPARVVDILPSASKAEVREWVRSKIREKAKLIDVDASFRKAFTGRRLSVDREEVRKMYREEYAAHNGATLRPGPREV